MPKVRALNFQCPVELNNQFLKLCQKRDITRSDVLVWYIKAFYFKNEFRDLPVYSLQPEPGDMVDSRVMLHVDLKDIFYSFCVSRHRSVRGQMCAFMRDFIENPARVFD